MSILDTRTLESEIRELEALEDRDEEDSERLQSLEELRDEFRGDWTGGTALIPDGDEWEDYCRETAYDFGFVSRDSPIESCIDWGNWADACRSDYSQIDFDGETYLYRS